MGQGATCEDPRFPPDWVSFPDGCTEMRPGRPLSDASPRRPPAGRLPANNGLVPAATLGSRSACPPRNCPPTRVARISRSSGRPTEACCVCGAPAWLLLRSRSCSGGARPRSNIRRPSPRPTPSRPRNWPPYSISGRCGALGSHLPDRDHLFSHRLPEGAFRRGGQELAATAEAKLVGGGRGIEFRRARREVISCPPNPRIPSQIRAGEGGAPHRREV